MKFYIEKDEKRFYLEKIEDGFLKLKDENNKEDEIDLALVKKVHMIDNDKDDIISITQYMLMTDQLKNGNEWEVNKWLVYVFFSVICSIINGAFACVGLYFTLYTIPLILVSLYCSWSLYKINKKKLSIALFLFIGLAFLLGPLYNWFLALRFNGMM